MRRIRPAILLALLSVPLADAQIAVRGKTIYTMAGEPLKDGVVIVRDGKIAAVGRASEVKIPDGFQTLDANVVTPGLIDAHSCVGLTGILNYDHDQEQVDRTASVQPELRAIDAYNPQDRLIDWVRSFGITTVHTGHAPQALISGQTAIVKTIGNSVRDCVLVETAAIAATLGDHARRDGQTSPGTRGKMMAMLRAELLKAQDYLKKLEPTDPEKKPARRRRRRRKGEGRDEAEEAQP
jgi:imidazolonepropionase-like amidohydrolase